MRTVIDVAWDVSNFAHEIANTGIETVIRYYNHRNVSLPSKQLKPSEAQALNDAGLSLAVVFQQRAGHGGHIDDFASNKGERDSRRALELAETIGQPDESAIYFSVDHDFNRTGDLETIIAYFTAVQQEIAGRYRVGVYGSGKVGETVTRAGLADLIWLAGATGWTGTQSMLETADWTLFQRDLHKHWPDSAFVYDGNVVNPAFPDYGQFRLDGQPGTDRFVPLNVLMEVTARTGLNVRRGPGQDYSVLTALPFAAVVTALSSNGEWIKVDLEGDGQADGFMHGNFLRPLSGGFPLTDGTIPTPFLAPIDVARAEMRDRVLETASRRPNNPRIVMYHATTRDGFAPDETSWGSSFVNYCVEQAGFRGTGSKSARSWVETAWGREVTSSPEEGDIAVFARRNASGDGGTEGGHVGFFTLDHGESIRLLGANQGHEISLADYPKDGIKNGWHYRLVSVRRP